MGCYELRGIYAPRGADRGRLLYNRRGLNISTKAFPVSMKEFSP